MTTKEKAAKKTGMRVIPTGERKCIWMDAGVVSYKLCTNQFQCNTCDFDLAMSNRAKQTKMIAAEARTTDSDKKEIVEWMEEFRHLPGDMRKCRYMLMGEVSYKICPNSFRCGDCTFDQMMQDRMQPAYEPALDKLPQVAGFYMSEKLYYFRNHTWLKLERNGQYRIGIDDFAGRLIGDPKGVKLPPIGRKLDMEELCWTIDHEYGDMEFVSPVNGVVTATNRKLLDDTGRMVEDPYAGGWLMTVEPKSIAKSNRNFLYGDEARTWMVDEANLLVKSLHDEAGVTLHDGAALARDIYRSLDKEKWQKIVKNHLHTR